MSLERARVSEPTPETGARILLVEDDATIQNMLADALREAGFAVAIAASGAEMDRVMSREKADLVLLDLLLPDEDGRKICTRLRAASFNLPIIIVTALGDDVDRIFGLELGADDYVTKPFNTRELIARIRALLRRARVSEGARARQEPLRFAGWLLHPTERKLLNPQGALVTTTSAEFDLLLAFCTHPGEVLSREQLLDLTHSGVAGPVERSVDVHVSRIRQKIEPDVGDPTFIKTIRLGGYIFTPEVTPG
ncbi:MAG: response regulator transcription factor [Pseudomonadota bacterium]|nr:response regulator transcription factor [Pseudomonadota bacterium]